jgi:hypothetical protein
VALLQVQRRRPLRHTTHGVRRRWSRTSVDHDAAGQLPLQVAARTPTTRRTRPPPEEGAARHRQRSDNQQKAAPGYRRRLRQEDRGRPGRTSGRAELVQKTVVPRSTYTRSRTRSWRNRTDQLLILASVRKLRYRLTERQNGNQFIPRVRDVWTVGFATRRCGVSSCGARIRSSMSRRPYLLPWLRVELLFRSIPTSGDEPTWAIVRREIPDCS